MSLSSIAIDLARRAPGPIRALLRVWDQAIRDPARAHWLFLALKDATGLRLVRTAALYDGRPIRIDPYDSVGGAIFAEGCYEPESVRVFERLLGPGARVVDAGAHAGQYSLIASRVLGSQGEVHAFEPDPRTFDLLCENLALNRCANVRANRSALSDRRGSATLHLAAAGNVGGGSLGVTDCSTGEDVPVETDTLDLYWQGLADPERPPDLIKADVEGAEWPLLKGAQGLLGLLGRGAPYLMLELSVHTLAFGYDRAALVAWLGELGYGCWTLGPMPLSPLGSLDRGPDWFNVLAVHRSRVGSLVSAGVLSGPAPVA